MRILLLGGGGQLGFELCAVLGCFAEVLAPDRAELDVCDADGLFRHLVSSRAKVVINASAYTDVDGAEREPHVANHVNNRVVGLLGEEAKRLGFGLIHFSTDFVFDGEKGSPYVESDPTSPLSEYGRSKLAGEKALLWLDAPAMTFRTAWVYSLRRKSYVTTMLRLAREKETLKVVTDQIGQPHVLSRPRRSRSSHPLWNAPGSCRRNSRCPRRLPSGGDRERQPLRLDEGDSRARSQAQ